MKNENFIYRVTEIQRFCMHDGPGVRTTVFFSGCPLHCFWCHNPETASDAPKILFYENKCIGCGACATSCSAGCHAFHDTRHEIDRTSCIGCGACADACPTGALAGVEREMSGEEIIGVCLRDKAFYGLEGGITLSGGEPMLRPEACISLLRAAKRAGLSTAVETSGFFSPEYVDMLCEVADTLLWDIKDIDEVRHIKNTGVSNELILKNLRQADRCGAKIILRCVLLRGVNLNEEHLRAVAKIGGELRGLVRIDLLPCHCLGESKAHSLGIAARSLREFVPTDEDMMRAREIVGAAR